MRRRRQVRSRLPLRSCVAVTRSVRRTSIGPDRTRPRPREPGEPIANARVAPHPLNRQRERMLPPEHNHRATPEHREAGQEFRHGSTSETDEDPIRAVGQPIAVSQGGTARVKPLHEKPLDAAAESTRRPKPAREEALPRRRPSPSPASRPPATSSAAGGRRPLDCRSARSLRRALLRADSRRGRRARPGPPASRDC
jgi:hypothetical protein